MNPIYFTKMQALGNDFIVIADLDQKLNLSNRRIIELCDRRRGVGCDQLLLILPSHTPEADFFVRIFNSDGSESFQCGNGMRCIGRYLVEKHLTNKTSLRVATEANSYELKASQLNWVSVNMREPILELSKIPFIPTQKYSHFSYMIEAGEEQFEITPLSMGNPHGVIFVEDLHNFNVFEIGNRLSHHPQFPERANIEFVTICSRQHIQIRIFERGAGETQACGSGACAAMVAARLHGLVDSEVRVEMPGGYANITWLGIPDELIMQGPAEWVFEGTIFL